MKQWKGAVEWEEVRPLGGGGQSRVFLVRNSARIDERKRHLKTLMDLGGQGLNEMRAQQFSEAALGYSRGEVLSELGALKVYNPRAAGEAAEKQALNRLRVEIGVLRQNNRGLPRLLDSNESDRWVVTEYYPGGTLEDHLSGFQGSALQSLIVFRQIVWTVAALHEEGIFHRDIKPANIFFDSNGSPVLGDLGIAFLPDLPERLTFTKESVGPRDYMPPWAESEERLEKVSGHFDVYMLGKLLWCMVAGRLKLIREWYTRPEFDLTRKFQGNPQMHMINAILEKCLHDDPNKVLPQAGELLLWVDAHLDVIRRGGQMIRDDVPRPCRICGKGFYEATGGASGQILALPIGTASVPGNYPSTWRHEGAIYIRPLVCNYCHNIELFRIQ